MLRQHHIYIYSELPRGTKPLVYRCASNDTSFGIKSLLPGQSFHWNFKSNIFGTTLYSCRFVWELKKKSFDVFDAAWDKFHNTYNWVVKKDGFYVNFDPNNHDAGLGLLYTWDPQ